MNFTALLYSKKSAAEVQMIHVRIYGDQARKETTWREWFKRLTNYDFNFEDKEWPGTLKKIEDKESEALLLKNLCQVQGALAESLEVDHTTASKRWKALGMFQK